MVDRVNAALAAASDRVQNHIYDLLYPGSASVSGDVNYGWMIHLWYFPFSLFRFGSFAFNSFPMVLAHSRDIFRIASNYSIPAMSNDQLADLKSSLKKEVFHLKPYYILKISRVPKVVFGQAEVRKLITVLDKPSSWDVVIQEVVLLLVLFYTATHPGTLLPTQNCDYYLPLRNIELHP
jgi:hypothetical protein